MKFGETVEEENAFSGAFKIQGKMQASEMKGSKAAQSHRSKTGRRL